MKTLFFILTSILFYDCTEKTNFYPSTFCRDLTNYSFTKPNDYSQNKKIDTYYNICDTLFLTTTNINFRMTLDSMDYVPIGTDLKQKLINSYDRDVSIDLKEFKWCLDFQRVYIDTDTHPPIKNRPLTCEYTPMPFVNNDSVGITGVVMTNEGHDFPHYYKYKKKDGRWKLVCYQHPWGAGDCAVYLGK